MNVQYFAVGCSVLILVFIVDLIRREKMTFKYALAWLVSGAGVLLLALNERLLSGLSHWAGFALPSNFVFFLFTLFVIFLSLLLTVYANETNKRSEVLAQAVALLEFRLKRFETQQGKDGRGAGA